MASAWASSQPGNSCLQERTYQSTRQGLHGLCNPALEADVFLILFLLTWPQAHPDFRNLTEAEWDMGSGRSDCPNADTVIGCEKNIKMQVCHKHSTQMRAECSSSNET